MVNPSREKVFFCVSGMISNSSGEPSLGLHRKRLNCFLLKRKLNNIQCSQTSLDNAFLEPYGQWQSCSWWNVPKHALGSFIVSATFVLVVMGLLLSPALLLVCACMSWPLAVVLQRRRRLNRGSGGHVGRCCLFLDPCCRWPLIAVAHSSRCLALVVFQHKGPTMRRLSLGRCRSDCCWLC